MRVLALHRDVIVFVSQVWQTTCTAVRAEDEALLIDSPVLPAELDAVPGVLEQAGFPLSGLLATHGDWDHLLGRLAFPAASLGAAETTVARLSQRMGEAQRELRAFDEEFYVERPGPLRLGEVQGLPVPGRLVLGGEGPGREHELELHPTCGHTGDGMAILVPSARVLVAGDYVSPVEIPMLHDADASLDAYRETVDRLTELAHRVDTVIPGHGAPVPSERARVLLEEDMAYLQALDALGRDAPLPEGRRSAEQRKIHAGNVARLCD